MNIIQYKLEDLIDFEKECPIGLKIGKVQGSKHLDEDGFLLPCATGVTYHGLKYSCHALERMAPPTEAVVELLLERAFRRMESGALRLREKSIRSKSEVPANWWYEYIPRPRAILPDEVELEMNHPGSTDLEVIVKDADNTIVTVIRKSTEKDNNENESIPIRLGYVSFESITKRVANKAHILNQRYSLRKFVLVAVELPGLYADDATEYGIGIKLRKDNRCTREVLSELRIQGIIERRSKYVREKSLVLSNDYRQWKEDTNLSKDSMNKNIDIIAWKNNKKILKQQEKFEKIKKVKCEQLESLQSHQKEEKPREILRVEQPAVILPISSLPLAEEIVESSSPVVPLVDCWEDL